MVGQKAQRGGRNNGFGTRKLKSQAGQLNLLPGCVLSHFSRVQLFLTPGTVAHQAPLSMRFSRQEYWSGLPFPPSGDFPDPGIKPAFPASPALQVDSLPLELPVCALPV